MGDDDIVETSEVYRLSDKMRSLRKGSKNKYRSGSRSSLRKDDASTQASISDGSDDELRQGHHRQRNIYSSKQNGCSSRTSFQTHDDECCDLAAGKPLKKQYYYGTDSFDRMAGKNGGNDDEKGYITANVKTSKYTMENDRVLEDKTFEEDFERSFKDKHEKLDVKRDFDRFREKTMGHTKEILDRATSPMLPPPPSAQSSEFIHRPLLIDSVASFNEPTGRTRSFYDHQIEEYENRHSSHTRNYDNPSSYSKPYTSSFSDNIGSSLTASNTWTHKHSSSNLGSNHFGTSYPSSNHRSTSSFDHRFSNNRTDFPDFAPLSSPYEIKSLTENAIKTKHLTSFH
ncbi:hypothetical protein SSS_07476 [Sarcoptes scabiei]|nr:hypothetical protein SSS_07476 [Sarcoptes scabiei]